MDPFLKKKNLKFFEIFLSFRILKFQKYFLDHLDSISEKKSGIEGRKRRKKIRRRKKGEYRREKRENAELWKNSRLI